MRNRRSRVGLALFVTIGALRAAPAAAYEIPGFELVYTHPVETTLANPDLRPPTRVWLELIRSAEKTIDIEQMYAVSRQDEPLEGIIDALEETARRGVRIRMILEKKMKRASEASTIERLRRIPGLELQMIDFGRVLGQDAIVHAKFWVVDGKRAYMGSQNFDWRSLKHVHELGVKITHEAIVRQMQAIFEHDWAAATRLAAEPNPPRGARAPRATHAQAQAQAQAQAEAPAPPQAPAPDGHDAPPKPVSPLFDDPIRLVASPPELLPPGVGPSENELVRLIGRARREIRVQVMSYSAHDHGRGRYGVIDYALRKAALRGVKVNLLVANWSTGHPAIDDLRDLARVAGVTIKVVTIPDAKQGFIPFARVIHSKYMVVDGEVAWIGTSNWEGGYLNRSRNLELVLTVPRFAERVRKLHEQLWTSPYAQPLDLENEYPKVRRAE